MGNLALRREIMQKVQEFYEARDTAKFVPGVSLVPVSGKVHDSAEIRCLVDASLDFWLTTGRYAKAFEKSLQTFLGVRSVLLCNSGSSANLLALSALTSPLLKERRLKPGDEVITAAAGFPTTVNPIIQNGLVPVFVDVDLGTYNTTVERIKEAIEPRTKAIFLSHTLGNPYDVASVARLAREKGLWLIEDNCDALGSKWQGKHTGSFGDMATLSFYPAHHITTGEGGAVLTDNPLLAKIVASFRDWGRDCWCDTGKDNTCGKRFDWELGTLPHGYDHKYIYSHIGYNMKMTDMQAAVGVAQMEKLPKFIQTRKDNFKRLYAGLKPLDWELILPEMDASADPSWFGFPICLSVAAQFPRQALIAYLERRKIATRLIFAGNILRQPAYADIPHRIAGSLEGTENVMNHAFWIGTYPGLTNEMIDYVIRVFEDFFTNGGGE